MRALQYRKNPFEIRAIKSNGHRKSAKIFGLSSRPEAFVADSYQEFDTQNADLYLSCGSSAGTDIAAGSVDIVVTDPPYFDNVHYSQLADFFYVWQRYVLAGKSASPATMTTRSPDAEVQQTDAGKFADNLGGVFRDCYRVLKADGLLVFTFQHSRIDGWAALLTALQISEFRVEAVHAVKAEMSVAMPKRQARNPVDMDMIFVCRKRRDDELTDRVPSNAIDIVRREASRKVQAFNGGGRGVSRGDAGVILLAETVALLSHVRSSELAQAHLADRAEFLAGERETLLRSQIISTTAASPEQLALNF